MLAKVCLKRFRFVLYAALFFLITLHITDRTNSGLIATICIWFALPLAFIAFVWWIYACIRDIVRFFKSGAVPEDAPTWAERAVWWVQDELAEIASLDDRGKVRFFLFRVGGVALAALGLVLIVRDSIVLGTMLLIGGLAGTANEFIDRQLIKYLVPEGAMAELGVYGAITKIAVVMMLFYQMYRLAAEPFFLSNFKKSDFVQMNAAALKYYVMASMLIFLGIALFRDLFALIVGRDFREGIFILPVVLGANVLTGVWLNLSFWYKREEKTSLAIVVTGAGLVAMMAFGFWFIPLWGYYGAAWARLASESAMVGVSWWLNRRFYPTPYDWRRIGEYVAVALVVFAACEAVAAFDGNKLITYAFNIVLFATYAAYLVRRERIDVGAMLRAALKRK